MGYDPEALNELLPVYYRRLFPYEPFCRWLDGGASGSGSATGGGGSSSFFARREFSFTLQDDIYLRYQSFANAEELRREVVRKLPHKIDVGAVYNARPCDRRKVTNFQPQEKELVFDIDMTDYDDIRTCCEGAAVCPRCWRFMTVALKVLDRALREDFGFRHLLWVYSGRRGVHCWVSDPVARRLGQSGRSAVAEYLQVLSGGDSKVKKVTLKQHSVHPLISKSIDIIKGSFEQLCLRDQDILGDSSRWTKVLALIPDEELRRDVTALMARCDTSIERWNAMNKRIQAFLSSRKPGHRTTANVLNEIMLQYAYPRLDINVSKGLNHLLKSPFCVHPKTGRVCVPIDPAKADQFDPTTVPTISQLADEIDQFAEDEGEKSVTKEYKKTSLREPVRIFEEFLSKLGESWRASNRQAAAVAAAAAAGAAGTGDHQGDVNMDF